MHSNNNPKNCQGHSQPSLQISPVGVEKGKHRGKLPRKEMVDFYSDSVVLTHTLPPLKEGKKTTTTTHHPGLEMELEPGMVGCPFKFSTGRQRQASSWQGGQGYLTETLSKTNQTNKKMEPVRTQSGTGMTA